ncbi:hypothetical protein V5O48_011576 [Marasmius crinis-equi]|uniref:Uncharacterized protein n=1 Tax=Marasmius crinis-equi TaxID=585013 RepID=A0ABR3F587_9AGAR
MLTMNVVLSDTLVAHHPDTPNCLAQIITRQQSDDLLGVVNAPSPLPSHKTILWQLVGPPTQATSGVDLSRIAFWIDVKGFNPSAAATLEDDLQAVQGAQYTTMVILVGFRHPLHQGTVSALMARLQVRYRAHCIECYGVHDALEHV